MLNKKTWATRILRSHFTYITHTPNGHNEAYLLHIIRMCGPFYWPLININTAHNPIEISWFWGKRKGYQMFLHFYHRSLLSSLSIGYSQSNLIVQSRYIDLYLFLFSTIVFSGALCVMAALKPFNMVWFYVEFLFEKIEFKLHIMWTKYDSEMSRFGRKDEKSFSKWRFMWKLAEVSVWLVPTSDGKFSMRFLVALIGYICGIHATQSKLHSTLAGIHLLHSSSSSSSSDCRLC